MSNDQRPGGCENCANPCTIHVTQIINGQIQKVDMCETCPKAQQMQDPLEFGVMEQLMGMVMQPSMTMAQGLTCNSCGYTEAQFRKTGRLGCAHCYDVFIIPKMDILRKIHNAVIHKGKSPKNQSKKVMKQNIDGLKEELKTLIEAENYEQAAKVRDQIKMLNQGLKTPLVSVKQKRRRKPKAKAAEEGENGEEKNEK